MEITDAERRDRLIHWLEHIFAEVQQLLINDHLFWELQKIVCSNDEFLKASGLFTQWIADSYSQSAIIGVRRQAKKQPQSISLKGFLAEVAKYPSLISRAHYMSLYEGKEPFHRDLGKGTFDRLAGKDGAEIPLSLIEGHVRAMDSAISKIEQYADRRVAHFDKREPARPFPTFFELSSAIKTLEEIVILYWNLLKGASLRTMLPTIQFDWKDVFRFAWEPRLFTRA